MDELLRLARSKLWSDRVRAGQGLSAFAGQSAADAVLLRLLLDKRDTAVIAKTGKALLGRDEVASWRLFVIAWSRATPSEADHLSGAFHEQLWKASLDPDRGVRIRRTLTDLIRDPAVKDSAQDLLARLLQ